MLELLFKGRKMLRGVYRSFSDDHLGFSVHDGFYELFDIGAAILIVGIGIDNDIGAVS